MVSERLSPFITEETSGERSITLAPSLSAAVLKLSLVLVLGSKKAVATILSARVFLTEPGLLDEAVRGLEELLKVGARKVEDAEHVLA